MDFFSLLPIVVLPNDQNDQDTLVICASGEKMQLNRLVDFFTQELKLRFMVRSGELSTLHSPRITWQIQDSKIIIAAAFIYSKDTYGRTTSAALIFESNNFPDERVIRTPELGFIKPLLTYLKENKSNILGRIEANRYSGQPHGGEFLKKKFEPNSWLVMSIVIFILIIVALNFLTP